MKKRSLIVFTAALLLSLLSVTAEAKPKLLKSFKATYPKTKLNDCIICHIDGGDEINSYGLDLSANGMDYKKVEALDSDTDGATNLTEINNNSLPGDKSSVPLVEGGN